MRANRPVVTMPPARLDAASLVPGAILALAGVLEAIRRNPFALAPRPLELQTVPGPGADEDDDDDDDDDDSGGGDEGNIEPDDEEGYDEDDGDDDDDEEPLRVTAWDLS